MDDNYYFLTEFPSPVSRREWRLLGISGFLIWLKTLMEQVFNPCGEFRWSPEGPVSQIHSPHLRAGAHGIFSDLLRSVQMLKRDWGAESKGNLPYLFILSKTVTLVLDLQWKTCLWAEHSDDDVSWKKMCFKRLILNCFVGLCMVILMYNSRA